MSKNTPTTFPVNHEPSRLDWALRMAQAGFAIFPVKVGGKQPLASGWQDQATTDLATIKQWFANATGMNYGLALKDGQAVIDLDRKSGAADGIQAFEGVALDQDELTWADPDDAPCFTVETPSGGRHLYVKAGFPVSSAAGQWPAGIDVRGTGGYVLGPGSMIDGKVYRPINEVLQVPEAPGWVSDRFRHAGMQRESGSNVTPLFELDRPANIQEARRFLASRAPAVAYQGGNTHTFATFAHLHQIGISEAKALELVSEEGGWNWRCDPPWDRGDLERIASNAYRYAKQPAGSRPSAWEVFAEASQAPAEGLQAGAGAEGVQDISELAERSKADAYARIRARFYSGERIADVKPVPHVVEGFIPSTYQTTAACAVRGMGKSVFLIGLGLTLANALPGAETTWMDQAAYGRHVIYFSYEDHANNCQHVRAWCERNRSGPDDVPERFHLVDGGPNLMDKADVDAWAAFIREEITRGEPALLVVDTWQRASSAGGQNRDDEMQACVHNLESLARSLNATPVAAFHPPKDGSKTLLGSSVLENSTAAIWDMTTPDGGGVRAEVSRIKGPGLGNYILFSLEDHALPDDATTGKAVSAKVAKYLGGTQDDDGGQERKRIERENACSKARAVAEAVRAVLGVPEAKSSERGIASALIERYKTGPEQAKAEAQRKGENPPETPRIAYPWRDPGTGELADEPAVVNIAPNEKTVRRLLSDTFPPNIPIQLPDDDGQEAVVRHVVEKGGKAKHDFRVVNPQSWHFGEGA